MLKNGAFWATAWRVRAKVGRDAHSAETLTPSKKEAALAGASAANASNSDWATTGSLFAVSANSATSGGHGDACRSRAFFAHRAARLSAACARACGACFSTFSRDLAEPMRAAGFLEGMGGRLQKRRACSSHRAPPGLAHCPTGRASAQALTPSNLK